MNVDNVERFVTKFLQVFEHEAPMIHRADVAIVNLMELMCPEPLMMLRQHVRQAEVGDLLLALATDPSTQRDIPAYCRFTSQRLVYESVLQESQAVFCFLVQKG